MYSFFKGNVEDIEDGKISLCVRDAGYEINMPDNEISSLSINDQIKVYTYLQVREDDMKLFGFLSKKTLEFFKKLILVSGVGPKVALGIIGNINSEDMCVAIATENVSVLKAIPGVGPKMAQKIIFELKDKILKEQEQELKNNLNSKKNNEQAIIEATTALQVLGYNIKQINSVLENLDVSEDTVEGIIRKVLAKMQNI